MAEAKQTCASRPIDHWDTSNRYHGIVPGRSLVLVVAGWPDHLPLFCPQDPAEAFPLVTKDRSGQDHFPGFYLDLRYCCTPPAGGKCRLEHTTYPFCRASFFS